MFLSLTTIETFVLLLTATLLLLLSAPPDCGAEKVFEDELEDENEDDEEQNEVANYDIPDDDFG